MGVDKEFATMSGERRRPRPVVGVGAVVTRNGEVLLIRRGKPPRRGEWSLPGGAQEWGETVFEAARREVREETGVEIEIVGLIDVVDALNRDSAGRLAYHHTLIDVAARWVSGEPRAADDVEAATWAAADDLDGYSLWSETLRVIEAGRKLSEKS